MKSWHTHHGWLTDGSKSWKIITLKTYQKIDSSSSAEYSKVQLSNTNRLVAVGSYGSIGN